MIVKYMILSIDKHSLSICIHPYVLLICADFVCQSLCLIVRCILLSVTTIGCFLCNSFNGSDTGCEDPFEPAYVNYQSPCSQGKVGRTGVFPASYCIKMSGTSCKYKLHQSYFLYRIMK
jgi:hypothetical protein